MNFLSPFRWILFSLFILGPVFGGCVTVIDGDCRLYIYILQFWTCCYSTVCISYGKYYLHVAFLHKLMPCLCPHNEGAFLWRVAYCYWLVIHPRCVLCLESLSMGIYWHTLDGNQLRLEACLQSVRCFKIQADHNTLNHLKVI
jgi:hypothetical protein